MPTAPVAAASLIAGFAVAQATGVRPLGGLVLLAAVVWCALRWRRATGSAIAALLFLIYTVAFAASHALADVLGTWGAVLAVSAAVGAAAWLLSDRAGWDDAARRGRPGRTRGRPAA